MTDRMSRPSRRARRAARPSARETVVAAVLAVVCGGGTAGATETAGTAGGATAAPATQSEERVLGREAIIGKLIPITGDPLEIRSLDLRVEFRINSAALTEGAVTQLRELGAALVSEALRGAAVGVYGHTDTSGRAQYNQALSERRAQAVADFLGEHFAIAGARLREVRGYGEARLRNDLPPDAPAQRRVEIVTFHDVASDGTAGSGGADAPQPPASRTEAVAGESAADGIVVRTPQAGGASNGAREEAQHAPEGEESGYVAIQ